VWAKLGKGGGWGGGDGLQLGRYEQTESQGVEGGSRGIIGILFSEHVEKGKHKHQEKKWALRV